MIRYEKKIAYYYKGSNNGEKNHLHWHSFSLVVYYFLIIKMYNASNGAIFFFFFLIKLKIIILSDKSLDQLPEIVLKFE